jgi:hypothetical protein
MLNSKNNIKKMKNVHVNLIKCGFLLIMLSSCSDFIQRTPLDFVSPENYLSDENQAEILLNGVYAKLVYSESPGSVQSLFPIHLSTFTDEAYDAQPWHLTTEWARGQGNAQSSWARYKWNKNYQGISRANVFLYSIERSGLSSNKITRFIAEAKFLRAWYYHDLVMFYGDVPLILEPGDLSNGTPFRTPKQKVIEQIMLDLSDDVISVLPTTYEGNDAGRITKGAALGLKSKVLLCEEMWEEAANVSQQIMELGVYELYPDYNGLFLEKNEEAANCEIMLQKYYSPDINPSYIYYPIGEWPAFSPTKQMIDSYYMTDGLPITESALYDRANPHMRRDPRFYASVFYPGCKYLRFLGKQPDPAVSTEPITIPQYLLDVSGFRCKKHFDGTLMDVTKEGRNTYFMRYAEVLLNYAEAQNEHAGPDASVYAAIDKLRDRAGMITLTQAMPGLSKDKMRDVIRNERKVELAFEGSRWVDIRRWKIGEEAMVDAIGYDINHLPEGGFPGEGQGETAIWQYVEIVIDQRQFNPNRDYLWPIPQREMDANPNMVQNPNY